jgi:glutamyl-tRNA reductase
MNVVVVGLNHNTAPVEIREKLCFPNERIEEALHLLQGKFGLAEAVILSTCNRVEIVGSGLEPAESSDRIMGFLGEFHQLEISQFRPHFYHWHGFEAVRHLFRVTSSLDSMILGEPQILGQVKSAYVAAQKAGTLGPFLNSILSHAFMVAKRIRSETAIASSAVSISYAAVELAKKIFNQLNDKTVLILGAGKMSELAVKHLKSSGISHVLVWNRTFSRAQELAHLFNGEAIPTEDLFRHIERADILISSTGSPSFILKREDGERMIQLRRNRPVFMIDIAVPRDIDPEINKIDNVFLYDIDDLQQVIEANLKQRHREALRAEEIVQNELLSFSKWIGGHDMAPLIISLRTHWDGVRQEEIARFQKQLGPISKEQELAIQNLTTSLLNKILHGPITRLKECGTHPDRDEIAREIAKIMGLKDKH